MCTSRWSYPRAIWMELLSPGEHVPVVRWRSDSVRLWLSWDPAAVKSPAWGYPAIGGRCPTAPGSTALTGNSSTLRYAGEPDPDPFQCAGKALRPKITGGATCNIPAGSTSCTVAWQRRLQTVPPAICIVAMKYFHNRIHLLHAYLGKRRLAYAGPSVTGYDYNDTTNILQIYTTNRETDRISTMLNWAGCGCRQIPK